MQEDGKTKRDQLRNGGGLRGRDAPRTLMSLADAYGLVPVLHAVFGGRIRVTIPFDLGACETSVDDLDFSPRAEHSLKRSGVFTVGGVIDLIAADGLLRIRNLGRKTQNEIKTRILAFGYDRLNESERMCFFFDVVRLMREECSV